MKNKRILVVTSYMSGNGGVERVIQRMNDLVSNDKDIDLTVVSLSSGEKNIGEHNKKMGFYRGKEEWLRPLKAYRFPFSSGSRLVNFFFHAAYMACFLLANKFDYVICTGPAQALYLSKLRKIFKFKFEIYAWPHFSLTSNYGDFSLCKNADYCLGISKEICSQLEGVGIEKEKIILFPNPFERQPIVNEMYSNGEEHHFVYIGRLIFEGQKRIKDIIDASALVSGNFKVHLIGDGADCEVIDDYIAQKGLTDVVIVHRGWHSNPWGIVERPDALLLSSAFEGLPTVLGEAMSRGIICISSDCKTGPRDFITDKENGFLFPVGDITAFAGLMQKIVDKEYKFDPATVSQSMDFYYTDSYLKRFNALFKK
ncbi:Probable poly(glycerol-phosphate) alpha-glucosyltransferase [Serratia entomophila]|uniref:glycosyltransferase n=1 Tax=Serratia entomophila TaxID=42906 RepID=UPI00217A1DB7|nr:glycosyltransferase [Serratia entomophila]CAI1008002.1 Probable poly(glycerol-phosphate) alpha-glucosyltransferase [Serratia entomophila]